MDRCKSCGAPIKWALTAKGQRIPIDPEPVEDGNIVLIAHRDGDRGAPLALREPNGTHVTHFATCPDAHAHRKRHNRTHRDDRARR